MTTTFAFPRLRARLAIWFPIVAFRPFAVATDPLRRNRLADAVRAGLATWFRTRLAIWFPIVAFRPFAVATEPLRRNPPADAVRAGLATWFPIVALRPLRRDPDRAADDAVRT